MQLIWRIIQSRFKFWFTVRTSLHLWLPENSRYQTHTNSIVLESCHNICPTFQCKYPRLDNQLLILQFVFWTIINIFFSENKYHCNAILSVNEIVYYCILWLIYDWHAATPEPELWLMCPLVLAHYKKYLLTNNQKVLSLLISLVHLRCGHLTFVVSRHVRVDVAENHSVIVTFPLLQRWTNCTVLEWIL